MIISDEFRNRMYYLSASESEDMSQTEILNMSDNERIMFRFAQMRLKIMNVLKSQQSQQDNGRIAQEVNNTLSEFIELEF